MEKRKERIYVCHTFYHVYVACLKELNLPAADDPAKEKAAGEIPAAGEKTAKGACAAGEKTAKETGAAGGKAAEGACAAGLPAGATRGGATIVLSRMSNDFGDLDVRARECGLFEEVVWFDEKSFQAFPELLPLKEDTGSVLRNMWNRVRFCRRYGQLEEPYVPVDFAQYRDIYVFCDSDPVGYYLSYRKIRYHAVEDGLDCIRYYDTAHWDNRGHFGLKARMAALGLIFIQNGYGRYCIDMEVNDIAAIAQPSPNMIEVPRERLAAGLGAKDRELLVRLFIRNRDELVSALRLAKASSGPAVLILTEPLCTDLAVRRKLFEDMIEEYGTFPAPGKNEDLPGEQTGPAPERIRGTIVIKPHPRDALDYRAVFPQYIVLDAKFPMEILNFLDAGEPAAHRPVFERVVTVYTVPDSIHCAKEKIYLGNAWMDRYEDKSAHAHVTDHCEETAVHAHVTDTAKRQQSART